MIKDIYAEYGEQTGENLNRIQKDEKLDVFIKLRLLSIFLGTGIQEVAKVHHRILIYRKDGQPSPFSKKIIHPALNMIKQLRLSSPSCTLSNCLPFGSFMIQFSFILVKPYLSKDDEEFYICENPIRKDKVFKIPMITGTSWKGNLRWTSMKIFTDRLPETIKENQLNEFLEYRSQLVRLFGYEKDAIEDYLDSILAEKLPGGLNEENKTKVKSNFDVFLKDRGYTKPGVEGRRGRLNFYPTFFDRIGLEVINPHDRKTKTGTQPIYIESVPNGTTGTFSLLYVPFDLIGKATDTVKKEVKEDLEFVYKATIEMMLTYGFSAKKSSGFGIIKDKFDSEGYFDMSGITVSKKDFLNFKGLEEIISSVINLIDGKNVR